jgi:TonB family protein
MARPETGRNLRRAPVDPDQFTKYTVELAFTVTRAGQVTDIKVVESNAPKHIEAEAAQDLQSTRYRPRFVNGEPVDTPGVHHRQNVFVRTSAPDIQAAY